MTVRPPRTPPPGASRQPPRGYWRGRGRQCARPPTPRSGASAERAGQPDMFHRSTVPAARVIRTLTLGLLAITLPLSARGLYGPQGAWVHVRWQPSVDATERQRLETAWQFVDGQEVSPSTWRYDLTAPTADRLRAIVEHPDIADTHYIDRQRYTLAHETLRTARRHGLITVGGAGGRHRRSPGSALGRARRAVRARQTSHAGVAQSRRRGGTMAPAIS